MDIEFDREPGICFGMLDFEKTESYDYLLPESLIATHPSPRRGESRLLFSPKGSSENISHHSFNELGDFLREGDLLVFNDTRVVLARLQAKKKTGGAVELFVLNPISPNSWSQSSEDGDLKFRCMTKSSKGVREGVLDIIGFGEVSVIDISPGACTVVLEFGNSLEDFLGEFGQIPLPPYIVKRRKESSFDAYEDADLRRYQTVFAKEAGAVAAPTAGLHFDDNGIDRLKEAGVRFASLTLHVGVGTFKPVSCDDLNDHPMHWEHYEISSDLDLAIKKTRSLGGRVVAIGTTSARALESEGRKEKPFVPGAYKTDIFIRPGFDWKVCDGLLTNFHLPKSTLLALVYSLGGPERIIEAYREAIAEKYRFYSYGDAMLIL